MRGRQLRKTAGPHSGVENQRPSVSQGSAVTLSDRDMPWPRRYLPAGNMCSIPLPQSTIIGASSGDQVGALSIIAPNRSEHR
jgi:hypothetical protein